MPDDLPYLTVLPYTVVLTSLRCSLLGSIASFAASLGSEQRGALMELVATYPPEEMRRWAYGFN